MKIGVNTMLWEKRNIELKESLKIIGSLGYKYVDIAAIGSANPLKMKQKDVDEFRKLIRELDLSISGLVMLEATNIAVEDSKYRYNQMKYAKACAEFQKKLGGEHVLIGYGCGSFTMDVSREKSWINSADFIKEYCQWLLDSNLGLYVLLEFDPNVFNIVNNTKRLDEMLSEVNKPNLYANIDTGHLNVTREPPKSLFRLKDRIAHLHLNDNNGNEDAHLALGIGCAPISNIIEMVIELGIDSTCTKMGIEPVAVLELGEKGKEKPLDAIKRCQSYLDNLNLTFSKV